MGPPPFGGGNGRCSGLRTPTATGFNGASAFRRWKSGASARAGAGLTVLQWGLRLSAVEIAGSGGSSAVRPRLQWGLRLSAVEIAGRAARGPGADQASMGPPPFGGGNFDQELGLVAGLLLQSGLRLSAVEIGQRRFGVEAGRRCFNGASAFRRWKC